MPCLEFKFPVGSSARISLGLATNALFPLELAQLNKSFICSSMFYVFKIVFDDYYSYFINFTGLMLEACQLFHIMVSKAIAIVSVHPKTNTQIVNSIR